MPRIQMQRRLSDYQAVILDVDGTLYRATALRAAMAIELTVHYVTYPWQMRDLRALRYFRALHNATLLSEADCYDRAAQRYGLSANHLYQVVDKWLVQRTLKYIKLFRNRLLLEAVAHLKEQGTVIVLYSDYPTAEKVAALPGLDPGYQFCAADPAINCFKPDPRGMDHILNMLELPVASILMIGDRDEKDGAAARTVGMDYLIIDRSRRVKDILRTATPVGAAGQEAPLS